MKKKLLKNVRSVAILFFSFIMNTYVFAQDADTSQDTYAKTENESLATKTVNTTSNLPTQLISCAGLISGASVHNANGEYYLCTSTNPFGYTANSYNITTTAPINQHQFRVKSLTNQILYTSPWRFGNNGSITFNPSPGLYKFEFQATSSCGTSGWYVLFVEYRSCSIDPFGIFSVYPNPATSTLNIEKSSNKTDNIEKIELKNNDQETTFEILDFSQNIVKKGDIIDTKSINVSDLEKGKYILKISTGDNIEVHQVIIE